MVLNKFITAYKLLFNRASLYTHTPPGEVKKKLGNLLPTNPVIVEAGAHCGHDTVFMRYLWPQSTIHAFEPVPDIFSELEKRTKKFKNVSRYNLALANENGTTDFYISEGQSDASSSLLKPKEHITLFPNVKFDKSIKVKTSTLDTWAKKNKVNKIDMLWLDMQGYELYALQAGIEILKTVKVIYTEVNLRENYEKTPLYPEVKNWMESQGFTVFHEDLEEYMGNVIFIRQNVSKNGES